MKSIYTDDYISIISVLRTIRIEKNITQLEMAKKLNVNQSFISKVENCERRLDVIEFLSWLDILDIAITSVLPTKYFKEDIN
ncbi:MAG: helix-turn-helix transcriptional regulator [Hespellia sp.]|nr:helix-turn-helix transcriptional regulator [Hespellia sp.]